MTVRRTFPSGFALTFALCLLSIPAAAFAQPDPLPQSPKVSLRIGFAVNFPLPPGYRDVFDDNGYHPDELSTIEDPVQHGNGLLASCTIPVAGRFSAGIAWLTLGRVAGGDAFMQGRRPEKVVFADPQNPPVSTTTGLREFHSVSSYYLLAAYDLLREKENVAGISSQFAIGAGAADVSIDFWLVDKYGDAYLGSRIARPLSFSAAAVATADYSIVRGFSLGAFAAYQYMPPAGMPAVRIKGEAVTAPSGETVTVYSTLNPYNVNFSAIRLGISARFDFFE